MSIDVSGMSFMIISRDGKKRIFQPVDHEHGSFFKACADLIWHDQEIASCLVVYEGDEYTYIVYPDENVVRFKAKQREGAWLEVQTEGVYKW